MRRSTQRQVYPMMLLSMVLVILEQSGHCTEAVLPMVPCKRPYCGASMNNTTLYKEVAVETILALNWTTVSIICETAFAADAELTVHSLQDHGLLTSLVRQRRAGWHSSNVSASVVLDAIVQNTPPSGSGGFLVLGDGDFLLQVFHEVSMLFSNNTLALTSTSESTHRQWFAWTSEWLALVAVKDQDILNDVPSDWEHVVVIDVSNSKLPVWALVRSGDSTGFVRLTSLCSNTPPLSRSGLLPNLVQGLSGRTLRVVVKQPESASESGNMFQHYVNARKTLSGGRQGFEGALIDILHELSVRLNFTYQLQESTEDSWGQETDNGRWDGLIGFLTRKEADLALSTFRLTAGRTAVADYTSPFTFDDAVLVFKHSDTTISYGNDDFFLRPLQVEVYAALLGCLLWLLLMLLLCRVCQVHAEGQTPEVLDMRQWLMADAEIVLAAMLNRSHDPRPPVKSPAGHVLLVTWVYVSVVVVGYTYSSQLTASLTVQEVSPPFSSLQQLVSQDTYTWGMANGTALQSLIQASHNKIYTQFWQGVTRFAHTRPEVLSPSEDTQLRQVLAGHYVYLMGSETILAHWQSLHCHLAGVVVQGFQKPAVFYLQKNSPYTSTVSDELRRMRETGIVSRILHKWTPLRKRCGSHNMTSAISLKQTQTAFYTLGIGICISLLALAVEVFFL